MKRFRIACRSPGDATQVFAEFACEGSAMVGLAVIQAGTTNHFWERHSEGDELLYCLEGEATFTATAADRARADCEFTSGDLRFLLAVRPIVPWCASRCASSSSPRAQERSRGPMMNAFSQDTE